MIYTFTIAFAIIIFELIKNKSTSFKNKIVSPSVLISTFILIYCILGVKLYWNDSYLFLGKDFSTTIDNTYLLISIFMTVFYLTELGTYNLIDIKKYEIKRLNISYFSNLYTLFVLVLSVIYFISRADASLDGIINLLFNTLIPVIGYNVICRKKIFYLYIIAFTLLSIFLGFRYRLILLYIPIILTFFVITKVSPIKIVIIFIGISLFLLLVAIVGVSRVYSVGLNFSHLSELKLINILIQGIFNDTNTILATGAFIEYVNENGTFAYFNQLLYIFEYLIPSFLLEQKNYSPILEYIGIAIGDYKSGTAVLGFAEFYYTGGVFAVMLFAFVYSCIFTRLYKKQIIINNLFHSFFYFSLIGWLLNSFTRGYLPQNYTDLISIIVGLYVARISHTKHVER